MSAPRRIFLSYARADDIAFVEKLYHDLKHLKFDIWWDKNHMGNDGTPFTQEIDDAIRASERLLFVAGPGSFASVYCKGEWETALKYCVPVLPLLRLGAGGEPGADYAAVIPARIGGGHAVDCRPNRPYADALNEIARIMAAPPPPPVTPRGVPELPDNHIDRPRYLDPLKVAIRSGDPLIGITSQRSATALHGVGGIGKTTLAKALCLDCEVRRTFDQIFWVEAGPNASQASASALMGQIGGLFGDAPDLYQKPDAARAALTRHLAGRKTLIVLDDVWDGGLARAFLIAGVDCRVVVTTRVTHLLRGGAAVGVDNLDEAERLRLMGEYLGVAAGDLPPECARIGALLGGHTLAVRLAAAWLAERGGVSDAPALLARLTRKAEGESPFRDLALSASDKNENLELCLSLSYDDLADDLKRRYRALGTCAPDGTLDAVLAGALWGDADDDDGREATEDALAALARAGLALRTGDRHSQHPLLRAYARALLLRAGEAEAAFGRYADYVIDASAAFDELPMERWGELDPLLPHVDFVGEELAARWADAAKRDDDLTRRAGEFVWNVTRYVNYRRQAVQRPDGLTTLRGMNWLEMGLDVYRLQGNMVGEATALNNIGVTYRALGEARKALDFCQQALPLYRAVGDRGGEAAALNNIGLAWDALGEVRKALDFYEQALPLLRAAGDWDGEATALSNIGEVHRSLGEPRKALDFYEQALSVDRAVGNRAGEATTLNNIGLAWFALKETWKALHFYEQAARLHRSVGDRAGEARTLNNTGSAWCMLGDLQKALDSHQQALSLQRVVGDRSNEAVSYFNIGIVYHALGDLDTAIEYVERCVQLDIEIEHPDLESDRQMLEQLRREREGGVSSEDPQAAFVRQIMELYGRGGADAVRSALAAAGVPEEQITGVIAQIEAALGGAWSRVAAGG